MRNPCLASAGVLSLFIIGTGMDCQGTFLDPGPGTIGPAPVILATDHVFGNANAPVTVVEYADFQ